MDDLEPGADAPSRPVAHRFVAPAINVDATTGMVDSMDPALVAERLILIDNTDDNRIHALYADTPRAPMVLAPPGNLGVGASWNLGARQAFEDPAVMYVTVTSTSMRFAPDGGQAVATIADFCADNTQWPYGFESLAGWHLITFGRRLFAEVGWFDERYWPAYFEDSDMIWRMRVAGILEPAGAPRWDRQFPWVPTLDYPAIDTAHTIKTGDVTVELEQLLNYYEAKWGGPPGEEQWTKPFNGGTRA